MITISARKIIDYDIETLWLNLKGNFNLKFDDGEIVTNSKETIYSRYVWEYHKKYPNTPLLKEHHVSQHLKNGKRLGANTHLSVINSVLWSVFDTYGTNENKTKLLDELAKFAYETTNVMYNKLTYKLEDYVTSLDITDFIKVTKHPKVIKANLEMPPTQEGIDQVYDIVKDLFKNDQDIKNNPVVNVVNSGLANMGQVLQCVAPRGFLTDIDSNIFSNPIKASFTSGIRNAEDMMKETRSAAKSMIFSTEPLQQSEYFSRRQQLICQNVKHIHTGDCGSREYLNWHVRDARFENNYANDEEELIVDINEEVLEGVDVTDKTTLKPRYQSDLKTLAGKYYLDETTNSLKVLKVSDVHLLNKTIKLRSVIAGCAHPDPYGVCEVCYGETALGIPEDANLGHIACVSMTAVVGQNILSTKHFDGSSVVEGIILKPFEKKYLNATINSNSYYLNSSLKSKKIKLIVDGRKSNGLTDIHLVKDLSKLSLPRISEYSQISIMVINNKDESEIVTLDVEVNGRMASLTYEMLKHIKVKGFTVNKDAHYEIDMTDFNFSDPILVLPMRHFNMSQHQSDIAKLLESTVEQLQERSSVIDPCSMIIDFHDLVNRRLSINLSILEIILYSSMGVNPLEDNYQLPKVGTSSGIGVMRQLLNKRSLSATMGYQGHRDILTNPLSFTLNNRQEHVFDAVLMPKEVLG